MHQYIHQLLNDHDCVVVPGLGGFLCKYKSAEVKWNELSIVPPGRMIAFNKALQQSDGLLIQSIAIQEHISYKKAEERVQDFVNHCLLQLQQQGSYMLPGIGRLYTDELKHIQFTPSLETLLLDDSFGLSSVAAIPIKRLGTAEEVPGSIHKDIEHPITEQKRKAAWPYWLAASFAGLFLAGTLWINGIQSNVSENIMAGFNPASILRKELSVSSNIIEPNKSIQSSTEDVFNSESIVNQRAISELSVNTTTLSTHKIVVGAFRKTATCEKLQLEIAQKGFQSEIHASENSNFLRVVILQQGATPEEALAVIKEKVNQAAWILK